MSNKLDLQPEDKRRPTWGSRSPSWAPRPPCGSRQVLRDRQEWEHRAHPPNWIPCQGLLNFSLGPGWPRSSSWSGRREESSSQASCSWRQSPSCRGSKGGRHCSRWCSAGCQLPRGQWPEYRRTQLLPDEWPPSTERVTLTFNVLSKSFKVKSRWQPPACHTTERHPQAPPPWPGLPCPTSSRTVHSPQRRSQKLLLEFALSLLYNTPGACSHFVMLAPSAVALKWLDSSRDKSWSLCNVW